jgi:glycosyltransferase involved in cell wall biosynthesis
MRIHFPIGAFYPSQVGGPCNTLYWHACALEKNKVDVSIVTTNRGIPEGEVELNKDIKNESGIVYYGTGSNASLKIILKALKGLRKSEILHLNSLFSPLSVASFLYARLFLSNKKIVWSVRGELNADAISYSTWKKKPLLILYKALTNKVLFHSTSDEETANIKKILNKEAIIQLPNYLKPSERLKTEQKKQVLFVGRIHPIKAIHKLIEAVSLSGYFLDNEYKLIIAGKQDSRHNYYFDELVALASKLGLKDKVEFRGHVKGVEKEKLFSESTVLVLPSDSENFGNVIVEALNQGTPVIASKGTPWSILEKYNCGFHVSNSPEDLAVAIDKVIGADEHSYNIVSNNAVELIDREFNIETQIHKWLEVYESLLAK